MTLCPSYLCSLSVPVVSPFSISNHGYILDSMNEGQIKIQIILIKSVDYLLLIAVFSLAIYTYLNPQNINMLVTIILLGLFLLNRVGHFTIAKIALLKIDLEKLKREEKSHRFDK